jgi:hypothetical protein
MEERTACLPPDGTFKNTAHWLRRPNRVSSARWAIWDGDAWRFGFGGQIYEGLLIISAYHKECPERLAARGFLYAGPASSGEVDWIWAGPDDR